LEMYCVTFGSDNITEGCEGDKGALN